MNGNYTRGGAIKCKIEKAMIFHIVLTSFPEAIRFGAFYIFMTVIESVKLDSVNEGDFCPSRLKLLHFENCYKSTTLRVE